MTIDGRPYLIEDRLLRSGAFSVVVHVAESLDELNRTFAQTSRTIVLILFVSAILVVALSILIAGRALAPIERLSRAMRQIGSERLDERLPGEQRGDEIGELTRSFNDLLARLQEAFARERQFISDASHELKTPLTSINANAQLLLRWGDRDETIRRESLETIQHESGALADMVNGMLTLAKADRGDTIPKEPVSLSIVAQEAVRNAAPRAAEKQLALEFDAPQPVTDRRGRSQIYCVSSSATWSTTRSNSRAKAQCACEIGEDESTAWIEVADTGPGIPDDELAHIFERFYRADKARSRDVPGTGLGLAIVRSIARVHGGEIKAQRAPSGGALFRARFPKIGPNAHPVFMKRVHARRLSSVVMATTWRRGLAGLLSVFVFMAGMSARAHAANALIPTTPAPFVWIQLDSGSVTIRTWDRPAIQVQSDPSVTLNHAPPREVGARAPQQLPLWSQTIKNARRRSYARARSVHPSAVSAR